MADEEKPAPSAYPESDEEVYQRFAWGSTEEKAEDSEEVKQMKFNRRINAKIATRSSGGGIPDIRMAASRPMDPMFWWRDQQMPFDISKEEQLIKLRGVCRFLFATHQTVASMIDLFSTYPVTEVEVQSKDPAVTRFFTEHFFEDLDYNQFFIDMLIDRFLLGEAWPLGTFNEQLGIWEDDELMDPDDIKVERSPFLKEPRYKMKLPENIKTIIKSQRPEADYKRLIAAYPELTNFVQDKDYMPVSNILLRQIRTRFPHNLRGVPILMRAIRNLVKEEMLSSAQDSIASRLYMPFILAKLGASASDLGTKRPWVPNEGDRETFMAALDAAMAGDFRMLVYHFAVDITSVFGRETIPDLSGDFERIEDKTLQVFGLSKTAIAGAGQGETYAADALNLDLVGTRLRSAQGDCDKHFKARAEVVCEAQEFFDFEVRGGKRYPIMEEVLEVDPETNKRRVVQQPKLLIPTLRFKSMNLKSEKEIKEFLEVAVDKGVPISLKTRFQNIPVDLKEEREAFKEEAVELSIAEQERRKEIYEALRARGLLFASQHADLIVDFGTDDEKALLGQQPVPVGEGVDPDAPPGEDPAAAAEEPAETDPRELPQGDAKVVPLPRNKARDEKPNRPPESDERRKEMPKATAMVPATNKEGGIIRNRHGEPIAYREKEVDEGQHRLLSGPSHVGARRDAGIDPGKPLDEQGNNGVAEEREGQDD